MPGPSDLGVNAPNFALSINDNMVAEGIRACIQSIEYESADGMHDQMKLSITDPQTDSTGRLLVRDSKLFVPGNEMSLWMGYGPMLRHIGRAIIRKIKPSFPANAAPSMEVIAYTKDSMMSDTSPESLMERRVTGKRKKHVRVVKSKAGRRFKQFTYAEAVSTRAADYGFILDIDPTPDPPSDFIQKAHMTDYNFVRGLSNLCGYVFWVDGDEHGDWTLHFKDPAKLRQRDVQEKEYTFRYNEQDYSTLLSFDGELAITHSVTKLKAETKNWKTGKLVEAKIEEENDDSPDVFVEPGKGPSANTSAPATLSPAGNEIVTDIGSGSTVKLFLEEFSFEVKTNRFFETPQQLAMWANAWFRAYRELFIIGNGTLIGIETVMARQTHVLHGLGTLFDGKYYFTRVRHVQNASGYNIDFSARRLVPELPPVGSVLEDSPAKTVFGGDLQQ